MSGGPEVRQRDRQQLAEALAERLHPRNGMSERAVLRFADALLPVVDRIAAERAAEALREAAQWVWDRGDNDDDLTACELRARAEAIADGRQEEQR